MPLTDYITLGRSGLRVSPLCLGAMTFGTEWGLGTDEATSRAIMDAYIDRGGNFIDTANVYNKGHSEAIIGDHLGCDPAKRDRLVIATKFLGNMYPGDPNGGGSHRKSMVQACEESLRRLRTDSIDLYWAHFWDRHTPIDETMRALDDLVTAGKVRYIGFSDTPAWKCAQAQGIAELRGWSPLIALQIEYSLIERTVEGELIPMAMELGLGVTPWSPLKGGLLTGKYTRDAIPDEARYKAESKNYTERNFAIVDTVVETARQLGVTPAQVALAWVQNRPGVASTIIGARRLDQLEDNLAALDVELTADQRQRLDTASTPSLGFPHTFVSMVAPGIQNGTTINGVPSEPWPLGPQSDDERW